MQNKEEYKIFRVTIGYSENDQKPANKVDLIEFPSSIDDKNPMLHNLIQSYRSTKNKNRGIGFKQIDDAAKTQTLDEKIILLRAAAFKKANDLDEAAGKGQEFLVIQSSLSQEAFFKYIENSVSARIRKATSKISDSNFWIHRSTLMIVTMLLSAILLVLVFTVSLPIIELLLSIFTILVNASMCAASLKALIDFVSCSLSSHDHFDRLIDWIKNNQTQTIIGAVGVGLSLVGLVVLVSLAPIIGPVLTLACGCSLFFYPVVLAVFGPTTIADAINRYLDVRQAENVLEDFKDGKQIELVPSSEPQSLGNFGILRAIFSKEVDKHRGEENNSSVETQGERLQNLQ